jgi:CDP-diglyceride synthetase
MAKKTAKEKLITIFSQPSTWRGIINAFGGLASALAMLHVIAPAFTVTLPICIALAGVVAMFTDDYASTDSKIDDIIHAITSAASNQPEQENT